MQINDAIENILDSAPCGYVAFTEGGTITRVNQCMLEYTGYAAEELQGRKIESIITLASRIFYQTHFYPLIKLHGKAEEIFLTLISKNRKEIPVLVNASKTQLQNNFVIQCVMVRVTQRGKYEEEILQAKKTAEEALDKNEALIKAKKELELNKEELDRKISRLIQKNKELIQYNEVISHDLQEPLRKINLFTDVLFRDNRETLSEMGLHAVNKITEASNRMREIVLNLDKLLLLDTVDKNISSVDLNEVLAKAIANIHHLYNAEYLQLYADKLPEIKGFREQLELLFYHLIENALKFTSPGEQTVIRITCSLIQHNSFQTMLFQYKYVDFVKIDFMDNGIGFDATYSEYIFLILKKLNYNIPGLGFGLAFCKKIVENHFGTISAASTAGQGAAFTILLPVKQHG